MSAASTPQTNSGQTPQTKSQTPTTVDFDTPRVEELFEAPLHEYNIHTPDASMASQTDNLLICTMVPPHLSYSAYLISQQAILIIRKHIDCVTNVTLEI